MQLPDIDILKRLLQSLAMLDAIIEPEWEDRYYSFNSKWAEGEEMGSFRDGQGDHVFALFNMAGCWIKGFTHEEPLRVSLEILLAQVPTEFASCLTEPAFMIEDTTFCLWRKYDDVNWQIMGLKKSMNMLGLPDGRPQSYLDQASDYFERDDLPIDSIQAIYSHHPLSEDLVQSLNPEIILVDVEEDKIEIGYP